MVSTWNSGASVQPLAYDGEKAFDMDDDKDFTFVDFLPEVREHGGFFTASTFETFR